MPIIRKRVFIIDDSEYVAVMLKKIMEGLDYEVVGVALNADDAMAAVSLNRNIIDLVTLDICLGKTDGTDLIEKILKLNPKIIVVMVSSNKEQRVIIQSIQLGAKHY
ncbi:MAG: response regulator, partial [Candidatus Margulisiibacteriota bacterium]